MNNNMHIANMSFGCSSSSSALQSACDNAYTAGVLLVAAAGNSGNALGCGNTVNYPAKYASVMAVAAVDSNNQRPLWSSHGAEVEIAAPGVDVYSTYVGGSFATMSGTSMASPHVAGVAALVQWRFPGWSNISVRNRLNTSATYIGNSRYYGSGLVQATAPGGIYSTYIGGGYATSSGTSMASPHVAGVAALVKWKYSSWSNVSIRNRLNSTALYLGNTNYYGNGLVRAVNATQ